MVSLTFSTLVLVTIVGVGAKNLALETNDVSDHFVSTNINFIFDMFLSHYTGKLIDEGKTQIQTPDFVRTFSTKILSMDIEGAIRVNDGWCGNLSTLHRTGDADMERVGQDVTLSAHLGLNELKIDYNNYDVSILGEHQKGKIHIKIGDNSLWLKLQAQIKPSCVISLTDLKIEKLENIDVDVTNLGPFENLSDEIISWISNEVTKWYRNYIEKTVFPDLSKAVKDADLCHYLPF